MEMVPAGG